ncbi:MAG: hypothetical protein OXC72_05815, partial [Roseovarius sp.]|nr:hypothetical protein [Roseovarius sp.]
LPRFDRKARGGEDPVMARNPQNAMSTEKKAQMPLAGIAGFPAGWLDNLKTGFACARKFPIKTRTRKGA